MAIKIRKLEPDDVKIVRQNPLEEAVKNYPEMYPPETAFAGVVDGKVVGIGGIVVFWEGVAEGWLILSKDILNQKTDSYRCIKEMMSIVIKKFYLRRLQITVRTDYQRGIKMVERLGFVREGLMKFYCPDKCDAYVYAKIIGK